MFDVLLQQMEFEWVLHEEVHNSLSQLRNILMVSFNEINERKFSGLEFFEVIIVTNGDR